MDLRDDVRARVDDFLRNVCGVPVDEVSEASRLADVDVDSLELVALVQQLEARYDVKLTDERLFGIETVGELVDLVEKRVADRPSGQVV
jgi:acyl carrier protein